MIRCPRGHRTRRAWAAWLGTLALLLHALIPIGQGITVSQAGERDNPFDQAFLVICAAYGITPLNQGQQAPSERTSDSHACVICQIQSLGKSTVASTPVALPKPTVHAARLGSPARESDTDGRTPRTVLPRAPPSLT